MTAGRDLLPSIVAFDDPLDPDIDARRVLGGKGAGLVEMRQTLGLPVPPGFTVTTDVCRRFLSEGWPPDLDVELVHHIDRLGGAIGARFGESDTPFLVSVRSGAPVSMPGMMDTVLNVGMTDAVRQRLARESGDPVFAADTWLRSRRSYTEVVTGIPPEDVAFAAQHDGSASGRLAAADRVATLAAERGEGIPEDPHAQLRGAIAAVFRSWESGPAVVVRARERIPDDLGTAVTVQAMVFGNLDDRSGAGVVFSRDPSTGAAVPFGDYLVRAQGDDVVGGTHHVDSLETLRARLPETYRRLLRVLRQLERHHRDMCDVEFTVSKGQLYVLQTRVGRRSARAAVRIAVDMASEPDFPLSRAEAVSRIDGAVAERLADSGGIDPEAIPIATGLAVSPGVGVGELCCDADRATRLGLGGVPVVLARTETSRSDIRAMASASALITVRGGVASHAAVVARGWAIPAVAGLADCRVEWNGIRCGETFIAEGEVVTVDGTGGAVHLGNRSVIASGECPELVTLRTWATELGLELGTKEISATSVRPRREASVTEVARAVQFRGVCGLEQAAATLLVPVACVGRLVEDNAGLFRKTERGLTLSVEGQHWLHAQLGRERESLDQNAAGEHYERFSALDGRFKRLVTDWQLLPNDDRTESSWAALVASIADVHGRMAPLVEEASRFAGRLSTYGRRFDAAFDALTQGDRSMLASPLKDSYHTIWFEYHEELISLTGRTRSTEGG